MSKCGHSRLFLMDFANQPKLYEPCLLCERQAKDERIADLENLTRSTTNIVDAYEASMRAIREALGLSEFDDHELVIDEIKLKNAMLATQAERIAELERGLASLDKDYGKLLHESDRYEKARDAALLRLGAVRSKIDEWEAMSGDSAIMSMCRLLRKILDRAVEGQIPASAAQGFKAMFDAMSDEDKERFRTGSFSAVEGHGSYFADDHESLCDPQPTLDPRSFDRSPGQCSPELGKVLSDALQESAVEIHSPPKPDDGRWTCENPKCGHRNWHGIDGCWSCGTPRNKPILVSEGQ